MTKIFSFFLDNYICVDERERETDKETRERQKMCICLKGEREYACERGRGSLSDVHHNLSLSPTNYFLF